MKFWTVALASLGLLATTGSCRDSVASPTNVSACANKSSDDIRGIVTQVQTLISDVSDFKASAIADLIPLLQIQLGSMKLAYTVFNTTQQLLSCPKFNYDDTAAVVQSVLYLVPQIHTVIDQIKAKKPEFDKAVANTISAGFVVKADLVVLQNRTKSMGDALLTTCDELAYNTVSSVLVTINGWFDDAIQLYAGDPLLNSTASLSFNISNPLGFLPNISTVFNNTKLQPELLQLLHDKPPTANLTEVVN